MTQVIIGLPKGEMAIRIFGIRERVEKKEVERCEWCNTCHEGTCSGYWGCDSRSDNGGKSKKGGGV